MSAWEISTWKENERVGPATAGSSPSLPYFVHSLLSNHLLQFQCVLRSEAGLIVIEIDEDVF